MSETRFMPGKIKLAALLSASLIFSGCASTHSMSNKVDAEPDLDSMKYLEDLAVEARHQLRILAKMKEATAIEEMTDAQIRQQTINSMTVPPGFEERVDFGPMTDRAEVVAEAVAAYAGYEFDVVGNSDGHETTVSITLEDQPLNEALHELGAQTGDLVDIHMLPNKMLFEYKSRRHLSNMPSEWGN